MSVLTAATVAIRERPMPALAVADVVLAAHGSRDPRAAADTQRFVAAVAAARPDWRVRAAYLDFTEPALGAALHGRFGPSTVVPLLLTPAYHARVDVPGIVAAARDRGVPAEVAPVLGPVGDTDPGLEPLVAALVRRLHEASGPTGHGVAWDSVVLGAAGSRDGRALATVETVANAVGARLGVPCLAGYASGVGPSVSGAVESLRAAGGRRPAYASMFLAAGILADRASSAARSAGARVVARPMSDAPELVTLLGIRVDAMVR